MAAQFLTTSRLSNIVNMITLGRQSGILRVIRGQGPARELGQIKFTDGEPVSALLGQLTGPNALGVLMNWGECIYSFDEYTTGEYSEGDAFPDGSGRGPSEPGRYSPQVGVSSGSWPTYYPNSGMPNSFPSSPASPPSPPYSPPPASNYPSTTALPNLGPQSGYPPNTSYPMMPGGPSSVSGEMPRYDSQYGGATTTQIPMTNTPITPEVLATVFRRSILADHTDQLPLDRRERMILLLVDGRRNLSDLARLTRRSEREVLSVLEHLATLGLVQVIRP